MAPLILRENEIIKKIHRAILRNMILLFFISAGVGRTGTFLAMWQAIKEAVATGEVSICDYVIKMRQSRYLMVQNYVSTHIIIIECINMYSENVSLRRRIRNQT